MSSSDSASDTAVPSASASVALIGTVCPAFRFEFGAGLENAENPLSRRDPLKGLLTTPSGSG